AVYLFKQSHGTRASGKKLEWICRFGYTGRMDTTALSILNHIFGYKQFRGQQAAIIEGVTQGKNTLVVMPTGGGKSLCYQIPSLLRPGIGVVVSPLIALMQDQ